MRGRLHAAVRFKQLVANGPSSVQRFSVTCWAQFIAHTTGIRRGKRIAAAERLPPGQKSRLPTRMMVHCRVVIGAAAFVIGRTRRLLLDGCSVDCVWSGSQIVLFLQHFK